jgi:dynein heavy chain, axonemal
MKSVNTDQNVLLQCDKANRLEELISYTDRLDRCQKSLSDYLETKRNYFPRFYFISDDELLSILGSSDPLSCQIHMAKMFANCRQLFFANGGKKVVGMQSAKREKYDMRTPVSTDAVVEEWLSNVELEMQASLRAITKEGVFTYGKTFGNGVVESKPGVARIDWINSQVGMVSIMGTQTWWTWEVEDSFMKVSRGDKYAVKTLLDRLGQQVNDLINKTRDMTMSNHMRKKVGCLIILDVHGRDIVDSFVRDSILDQREFAWESQLRFYWDKELDDVAIKQCTGTFPYGYEYQGLNGRLVITPLTDRIVMTLTQALTFHLGGSPAGPAGTGKTETVKDLAKTMGLPCFVTNCGEGLDYKAVGAIFSGLAAAGAWGCFDEFNRINVEVLSVVSAQLKSIQTALHLKQEKRDIGMGREIRIRRTVGIFITMNPGYAGRTELPDNLKALFRPIAVIVPDMGAIAEIMLMSEGFNQARNLGKKMTVLYKLASEQLSKQFHYGFGLREMKTVLVMAGSLKRSEPELTEDVVLMRALRDMNMPKFVFEDVPLFLALIQDLFPNLSAPRVGYKVLVKAITDELEASGNKHSDEEVFNTQVDKIVQLYETMIVRHTSQVVGPPGGGKTVVIETLKRALLPAFGINIKTNVLNPKAIELYELYGFMDPVTRDWTDGILSNLFRDMNRPLPVAKEGKERHWLLFDGDVDAEWVENMNSVMDDNRLLTLPNGERIQLQDFSKLIIETYDLQFASPATISRCGMVWVDPKFLGYRPYWEKWCQQQLVSLTVDEMGGGGDASKKGEDDNNQDGDMDLDGLGLDDEEEDLEEEGDSVKEKFGFIKELFDKYVPKCLDLVLEGIKDGEMLSNEDRLKQVIPISDLSVVKQLCSLLYSILVHNELNLCEDQEAADAGAEGGDNGNGRENDAFGEPDQIEGVFVFCLIWACGGALLHDSRLKLNDLVTSIYVEGSGKELFEHCYNPEERRWEKWEEKVPAYKQPMPFQFYKVVVPTADSVMYTYLLDRTLSGNKPCLLVGEPGTAKTTVVQNYLYSQPAGQCKRLEINLSSRTSAADVQNNIEANTEKKSGKIYGAPAGKKLVVFIDDMNMPKVDDYGTQQPIALLLFLIGRNYMYRLGKDVELLSYRDMRYVGAMGPPGGGRNPTDPRFVARFVTFNLTPPKEEILQYIFGSIVTSYFDQPSFKSNVKDCGPKMVTMLLHLFRHVQERLPPTPSKFHYIFTMNDLGKVVEGCCLATPDKFTSEAGIIRLWRNECTRLFCDRLTSLEDINVVALKIEEQVNDVYGNVREDVMKDPMVFGDFSLAVERLRADEDGGYEDPQLYEDQGTYVDVRKVFDDALEEYNLENKPMSLVLFQSALEHLTRVYRIMRLDRGNAMLVGFGGSGKQSMTKLAAFTAGYKLFEITLSRGYGLVEFKEDIKNLYKLLVDGPCVFLFTDAHVVNESFMEVINNMLTTGMVPALYEPDESDGMCNAVRSEVAASGMPETNENCWTYFVNKCRNNLHIVLAMSPAEDTLRIRCRSFPGMVSNTVIDWYYPWPPEALNAVATYFLQEENLPEEHRVNVVSHMVVVHQSMMEQMENFYIELRRKMYVTPKNFLDYISNYRSGMKAARKENARQTTRLSGGLAKLVEAADAVTVMSGELKKKKVIVDAKTIDCQAMIKDISEKTKVADESKIIAEAKEVELTEMAAIIKVESAKAQEQLGEALPALEAAAEALKNLDKADIGEVKQFTTPPEKVQSVVMCVMILKPGGKEKESDGWKGGKVMMSQGNFLASLKGYDKDKVTASMARKVKQYYRDPSFTPEGMKSVSKAAAGMLQWVVAIVKYYDVAKNVEPLRKRVRQLEKDQARGNKELAELTTKLSEITALLSTLNAAFTKSSGELEALTTEADTMERKLNAATKLINGLSSERTRWTVDLGGLSAQLMKVVGDRLISASFLSYVGAFDSVFRQRVIEGIWMPDVEMKKIPLTTPYNLSKQLVDDATKQTWVSEGLPADELSVQNGILTTVASRFPLCIDPQEQAVSWIKRKHANDQIIVKTFNDSDFIKHMELAITYGRPFLFEKVENFIDPVIDPILEKLTYQQQGQTYLKLGDKAIEWDVNFCLYLTSKLANPHYSPEVSGKCIIINYSVTMKGLENQLLNVVVGKERPDLEKKYADLVVEMSESSALLLKLEDTLLRELSNSTGDILENEELIATLDNTKTKAVEISAKLKQAKFTEAEINKSRTQYTSAAKRGSILFFTIAGLATISKMYTISLGSFLQVFKGSLMTSARDVNLEKRLKNIIRESTMNTYDYACTGIFEKHKLMFSMQLTTMIMDGEGTLDRNELNFFLKGDTSLEGASEEKPSHLSWILDNGWKDLIKLTTLKECFKDLLVDISKKSSDKWREWYDLEDPENVDLPSGYTKVLNAMQSLLVLRCFRPDRVYNAVKLFIIAEMGDRYVQPPTLNYESVLKQSAAQIPVIFVLSPGADPQSSIEKLAEEKRFTNKFKFLSLGQGQDKAAEAMMTAGANRGHWVLLQNCHLLSSWLPRLSAFLEALTEPHVDYRLWLTTNPTSQFPLGILQRSLKVVTEPPDGLRLNMRSSYSKIDESVLNSCDHPAYRPLMYVLCFYHAVVQERRKYGKIGWNVRYDFNDSDIEISQQLLRLYLNSSWKWSGGDERVVPWGAVKYLIGDAMYGGRVTDDFDRRVLRTYLNEYMGDFIFDTFQTFYFSQVGFDYTLPGAASTNKPDVSVYKDYVETLPLINPPGIFGLHANAEISYLNIAADDMWRCLIDLQPRVAAGVGGMSREEHIAATAADIQAKVPKEFDLMMIAKQIGVDRTPAQIVLLQELERWNKLVVKMGQSLSDLQKALVGEIGMSDALDELGAEVFNGFLPSMFRRLAPDTQMKLGKWWW